MNRLALLPLPLALALTLASCVTFHTIDDGIDRGRIGETLRVGPATIVPVQVVEDSRCPAGVSCIQAGTVRLSVRIDGGNPLELQLGQPATAAGGNLTLVEVSPGRRKDSKLYSDEYRFGFRFTRQPS